MAIVVPIDRNAQIVARLADGCTIAHVGQQFGLSAPDVRRIFIAEVHKGNKRAAHADAANSPFTDKAGVRIKELLNRHAMVLPTAVRVAALRAAEVYPTLYAILGIEKGA
ncbi:hypothetical protein BOFL111202_15435 [Bordetella flabilis]